MDMQIPKHIAVVVDGNRRWAQMHGKQPWEGHYQGSLTFDKAVEWMVELGIPQISVYALSTENLNRPKTELRKLYDVMCATLERWVKKQDFFKKYEIKVNFFGDMKRLPTRMLRLMQKLKKMTSGHKKKIVNILLAYGAKLEITNAVKLLLRKAMKTGKIEITQKDVENSLMVNAPVDLVIRTGGKNRLSNFLLWQVAYADIYTTETLWPDFTRRELIKSIKWWNTIQRNYGM
jgi:undecaprenyl diphosphate synthase